MPEAQLLSGKTVSESVYASLNSRITHLKEASITPGLAVILVGENPASQVYVRSKTRKFEKLNLYSETIRLPDSCSEEKLLEKIQILNADDRFHGILVQLPLPKSIDEQNVLLSVAPSKDVDGFHPLNLGLLTAGNPRFIPCTPKGILRILEHYDIDTDGKRVVVVGRSNIVGRPMSILLSLKRNPGNATVTLCHTHTQNQKELTRSADILISATGVPESISGDDISEGAVVIDVGINRVEDDSEKGYKLVGDAEYDSVIQKATALTPVPGGVGPMTIAMLVENTVEAAERLLSP
ncbi:MAG: bifunctional 5,10-methylenetetrahydrofolate dehydrogenase/5,10-methenyltetrahydrofolate cyclohydrolase [Candidatus Marinimicrobia bacterium]|jgi:methylenetetrahydrofolate dehydrogenase (NADP+)/methenyltetrahydrofolate cyclohydrolase|nr:bifunctional 5,10-methylenetetrahydrofolate dehydrogenase/5,10-methenyltetrahydrofolate cyclohydrolase [Candidatus Neomarinimicrobiota bacterium]MBT3618178.1 bifunctional 5,10-methylenetetrahydrofolate dehydrogenase/5,10-methenyltetrahydrofolate cyclohydrolase [Candidatus Neomarinimicrobiota bacterium]MBT3828649.1 bifunctional 5,10-methylenetetrahydrofolate dehydrogenase/5,10-methenyltetrahydrofolate cyclohydrolase [Candidatus Neomarinimicrobiota bacterium]MBT3996889.1 bifunctional 5,10-methy